MAFEDLTEEEIDELAAQVMKDAALSARKSKAERLGGYSESLIKSMGGLGGTTGSGQMAGKLFVPKGPGEAIAQGLRGYAAGKLAEKQGTMEEVIGLEQGQISGQFLRSMLKAMKKKKTAIPSPDVPIATVPEEYQPGYTPGSSLGFE